MEKFIALLTKGKEKAAMNEWKTDYSVILGALHNVNKKLGQFFFHTYSFISLSKDSSVLLKS